MAASNPFSSQDRLHFPEFSPMFNKKTPVGSEIKKESFKWSIDQLARLKPAEIDTDTDSLCITNKHSPDNDDERQKQIDVFFQQTTLPSPWPTAPSMLKVNTRTNKHPGPPKRVTFSPLPPPTTFIQEKSLVESQRRDSQTADVGTQTTLTFMNLDLEKLLLLAARGAGVDIEGGAEEGEGGEDRNIGNCSLRRKLFGQPERQDSGEEGSSAGSSPSPISPDPIDQPHPLPDPATTTSHCVPYSSIPCSPAIILTRHAHNHTPNGSGSDMSDHSPLCSSLVLQTPGGNFVSLSPISEGGGGSGEAEETISSIQVKKTAGKEGREGHTSPVLDSATVATCTSTPNGSSTSMKRQLAPSPFASPVLKHPCTTRDSEDNDTVYKPTVDAQSPPPSPSSLTEGSNDDDVAEPLSVADLCTATSDLTHITSTACTGYFNAMCLEDTEGDSTGVCPDEKRLHPLHSTAAHLGLTRLSNWQQTPVRFAPGNSELHTTGGTSQIYIPPSGIGISHSPGVDSGVGGSTELSSEQVTDNYPISGRLAHFSSLGHSHLSEATPIASTPVPVAGKEQVLANLGTTTPGNKPTPIIPLSNGLLPSRMKLDLQSHHLWSLPPVPPYATPTLRTTPTSLTGRRLYGISGASNSTNTTPHRYSSALHVKGVGDVVRNGKDVACKSPPFSDELLRRKEVIKSQLHFKSPVRTNFAPLTTSPINRLLLPPVPAPRGMNSGGPEYKENLTVL